MKISDWRVEYTITLLIIFAGILFFIPTSLKSTVQANIISKWKDCYKKLTYMQDVILKQEKEKILTSFKRAKTPDQREDLIIELIKPYFRLAHYKIPRGYKVKFMDKTAVSKTSVYYIDDYYFSDNKMIVGIKDIPNPDEKNTLFIMTFDINGFLPPNTWGKDVFGAKIYSDKVEALGKDLSLQELKNDCSPSGKGIGCSYYYQIGGNFSD